MFWTRAFWWRSGLAEFPIVYKKSSCRFVSGARGRKGFLRDIPTSAWSWEGTHYLGRYNECKHCQLVVATRQLASKVCDHIDTWWTRVRATSGWTFTSVLLLAEIILPCLSIQHKGQITVRNVFIHIILVRPGAYIVKPTLPSLPNVWTRLSLRWPQHDGARFIWLLSISMLLAEMQTTYMSLLAASTQTWKETNAGGYAYWIKPYLDYEVMSIYGRKKWTVSFVRSDSILLRTTYARLPHKLCIRQGAGTTRGYGYSYYPSVWVRLIHP